MNGMSWGLRKTVSIIAIILLVVLCLLSFIFFQEDLSVVKGLIFGALISILNFHLLAVVSERALNKNSGQIQTMMVINYLIRYAIYGITLLVAVKTPDINPIGTVIGLFTCIIALYITQIFHTKLTKTK